MKTGANSLQSTNAAFLNATPNSNNLSNSEAHTPFRANQQVSFGNLKVCIDRADQLTSREGWRDSFRKLMSTGISIFISNSSF